MANPFTAANIGVRRNFSTLGYRNYEPAGGAQYKATMEGYELGGVQYSSGDTLPFDGGDSPHTYYADDARMERDFNAGLIEPLT